MAAYSSTITLTNCTCDRSSETGLTGSYEATITADNGYYLSAVTCSDTNAIIEYSINKKEATITIADVTEDFIITAVGTAKTIKDVLLHPDNDYTTDLYPAIHNDDEDLANYVEELFLPEYSITTTVTNGDKDGASKILGSRTATVTISANEGYDLPSTITVTGASYTYDSTTGVISLSNPTGNVSITAVCVVPMNFATDSWADIAANIKSGNDTYQLGDTKTDTITIGGTNYTVTFKIVDDLVGRYITQSGSSHKVIEMQTVIGPYPSIGVEWNINGSASSYNVSDLKSWLNDTAIGYLPSALQNVLETTTVYSGPGNDTTTDANKVPATGKLFSPCLNEYYGASASFSWANNYETNSKGQFTYYYNQGVTTSNYSALIKQNLTGSNYEYWLRSPYVGYLAIRVNDEGNRSNDDYYDDDNRVCVCFA